MPRRDWLTCWGECMDNKEQQRANYKYYLSIGKCPHCGGRNPVEPGRNRCRECGLRYSEQMHNRREFRRANGLCTRCGRPLPEGHKYVQCDECRKYVQSFYKFNKARYESLKEQGLCIKCGAFAEPGRVLCRKCLDEWHENENRDLYREQKRQKRKECREKGLCIDCYTRKVEPGHTRCKRCRDLRMDSTRKYRINMKLKKGENHGNSANP